MLCLAVGAPVNLKIKEWWPNDGTVETFDSGGGCTLKKTCSSAVARFATPDHSLYLVMKFVDVMEQNDYNSCIVFAIANAVTVLFCHDPARVRYHEQNMRPFARVYGKQEVFHVPS